jgi:LAS superfamily LD-carboxypeptidase LdcB
VPHNEPARTAVAGLLVVIAAIAAAFCFQSPASSSSSSSSPAAPRRGLDPALLGALRQAAADAAGDGIELVVESGRRSRKHQARLLREAVAKYGSEAEAARWVASPDTSPHVSGDAVDIGPPEAAAWLSEHGAGYGLCQIYDNEPWHYELRREAIDRGCPPMYADPTHDPRMQR